MMVEMMVIMMVMMMMMVMVMTIQSVASDGIAGDRQYPLLHKGCQGFIKAPLHSRMPTHFHILI